MGRVLVSRAPEDLGREVLRLASRHKSVADIATILDITPAQVVSFAENVAEGVYGDPWSPHFKQLALLRSQEDMLERLRSRIEEEWGVVKGKSGGVVDARTDAQYIDTYLKHTKALLDRMDKIRDSATDSIAELDRATAEVAVRLVERAFGRFIEVLLTDYPDLDADWLRDLFKDSFASAAADLEFERGVE